MSYTMRAPAAPLHPPCDVVHHEGPGCSPVVAPSHSSEALLPGRVPDLKFDLLSGDFYDSVNNERLISSNHSKRSLWVNSGELQVLRDYAKLKKRDNYGSGWVGPGLILNIFLENRPKIVLY